MPTRDSIVQVPFVGSIDEITDPDQLQPPSMAAMTNCVVRKPGRIEKREGFQYLQKVGVAGTPADVFGGTPLSEKMEALGTYSGQDGSRLLLAANSRLYEYVGNDASHGYRDVNRLPSCYGTLHSVDATGGEIIEVESMVNDAGTLRCTVWVLGSRNGQDLTNDKAIRDQPQGTHGIYVAVQRISDGSFVTATTRILDTSGLPTEQVTDMRLALSLSSTLASTTRHWVVAYRRAEAVIEGFVVSSVDGSIKATQTLLTPFTGRPYWRAFDITNVKFRNYFLFAWCENDTTPSSSDISLRLVSFNETTGAFSTVYTMPGGVISESNASGTTTLSVNDWARYTPRGVVLETDPQSATVMVSVRMVYERDVTPFYLDGKFVVTSANCNGGSIAVSYDNFAWLHRAGFQTEDSFASFRSVTSTAGESKTTASCSQTNLVLDTDSVSVNTSVSAILTALFADGSYQPYSVVCVSDAGGSIFRRFGNPSPYMGQDLVQIASSGKFPVPAHTYPADNSVDVQHPNWDAGGIATPTVGKAVIFQKNITRVQLDATPGAIGFANTVQYCRLSTAAGVRCYAVISFDAGGHPTAAALYNGMGAANIDKAPSLDPVTSLSVSASPNGPWGAPTAVPGTTLYVFDDFNRAVPLVPQNIVFEDIGSNTAPIQQDIVDTDIGIEQCVHRWDVSRSGAYAVLAVSSTSSITFSNPNGEAPFGAASPFARSNYFEVYPWQIGAQLRYDLNDYTTTGSSTARPIWCALGGPWRMVSGLSTFDSSGRMACVLMPAGDDLQRSMFLVSFSNGNATVQTTLDPTDGTPVQYAGGVVYTNNQGVFVESLNMARVAAAPLNCPRLTVKTLAGASSGFTCGAIRQGQSASGSEVFAVDYTTGASSWRSIRAWGDYSVVNGGILSAYDGSSCNEATMLLWPQSDLTSIAYDRLAFKLYQLDNPSTNYYGWKNPNFTFWYDYNYLSFPVGPLLWGLTRPWFAYEAGLNSPNGNIPAGANGGVIGDGFCGWDTIKTTWGGDPTKDYQTVYIDPRFQQVQGRPSQASGAGVNQASMSHYYGRYQSGAAAYNVRRTGVAEVYIANWAPRSTFLDGTSAVANQYQPQNKYAAAVANGDFLARWCYEAVDGTGRIVRSAPSQAVSFTICATIQYEKGQTVSGSEPLPGGTVDEYRYGFFVPRLELTNRLRTAASDSKRTVVQPYFTAEPFATVFYQAPFSNFLSLYQSDFTISRNATRGVVPYSSTNAGGVNDNPLGLVTNNLKCFDGPQGEYNGLLSQPFLYTTGGVLDNVPPPSALCMTVHQNRLIMGGADDATVVWFSKELSPVDAPGFNDALTIQIEDGGPVTGLASMEGLLAIFKKDMTFIVPGDMPDDTGGAINRGFVSNTLGTPVRMPHGIGCIDHRSIVETPVGVFFQSQRTIELLSRDMSISPVGLKLDDTLTTYSQITAAAHNPKDMEVWFALRNPSAPTSVVFAVYNYMTESWSKVLFSGDGYSPATLPMTVIDSDICFATDWLDPLGVQPLQTVVYRQSQSKFFDVVPSGRKYVPMSWQTAPVAMNQVQGYQRMKRIRVFGSPIPTPSTGATQTREPHGVSFTLQTDYSTTGANLGTQTVSWTEAETAEVYTDQNREVYEVHVAEQKGQKLTLSYVETAPADISTLAHGYGTAFSNMALVVGLKAGLDKRITSGAKH